MAMFIFLATFSVWGLQQPKEEKVLFPLTPDLEEIFQFQDMYKIKKQEKDIESELKRLGYMDWKKNIKDKCSIFFQQME